MKTQAGVMPFLGSGHEPRNVGSLQKLEKARKGFFPGASRRNTVLLTI